MFGPDSNNEASLNEDGAETFHSCVSGTESDILTSSPPVTISVIDNKSGASPTESALNLDSRVNFLTRVSQSQICNDYMKFVMQMTPENFKSEPRPSRENPTSKESSISPTSTSASQQQPPTPTQVSFASNENVGPQKGSSASPTRRERRLENQYNYNLHGKNDDNSYNQNENSRPPILSHSSTARHSNSEASGSKFGYSAASSVTFSENNELISSE